MTVSQFSASAPAPVPLAIARSMWSFGIEGSRALWIASASAEFPVGSPPPSRAATVTARASLVKCWPRRWSTTAFLCLIEAHLECPDMHSVYGLKGGSIRVSRYYPSDRGQRRVSGKGVVTRAAGGAPAPAGGGVMAGLAAGAEPFALTGTEGATVSGVVAPVVLQCG